MKTARLFTTLIFISASLTLNVSTAFSAPPAKATAAPETNAVPQSIFAIPLNSGEARDPFFPSRIIQQESAKQTVSTNTVVPTGLSCLSLKGLSGTPANPLAMINGRTMTKGEDAEVTTECGRLLVHCVDISTNSAIIEVGGERRELHLRSDF